jgi:competence protein ComEC
MMFWKFKFAANIFNNCKLQINFIMIIFCIIITKYSAVQYGIIVLIVWSFVCVLEFRKNKVLLILNFIFLTGLIFFHSVFLNSLQLNGKVFSVEVVKDNYIILKSGTLKVIVQNYHDTYTIGEYVKVVGELSKINIRSDSWQFDFAKYLNDQNIVWKLSDTSTIEKLVTHNWKFPFFNWLNERTELEKIFIGQAKTGVAYANLVDTSLSFVTNVSASTFVIVFFVLRKIIKDQKKFNLTVMILAQLFLPFIFLLNYPAILVKTYFYFFLNSLLHRLKIRWNKFKKFSFIWTIELILNPWYIFNIGFVFITLCVIFFKFNKDGSKIVNFLKNFLIANLIFLPIQAFYDYKIFWLSSALQIVMAPITTFYYWISLMFVPFQVGTAHTLISNTFVQITGAVKKISLNTIIGHFPWYFLAFYYSAFKILQLTSKTWIKLTVILPMSMSAVGMCTYNMLTYPNSIVMLNVANGNSFVARLNSRYYLFDAGAGYGQSATLLRDYLIYYGVTKIDVAFISHNHDDHTNQLPELKKVISIKKEVRGWEEFNHLVTTNGVTFYSFAYPGHDDENSNSMVTYFRFKQQSFLFTGDLTNESIQLLKANRDFRALIRQGVDFYQIPHHGSDTSDDFGFLQLVNPKVAFISCKYLKSRPFPRPIIISNLIRVGVEHPYITAGRDTYQYLIADQSVVTLK